MRLIPSSIYLDYERSRFSCRHYGSKFKLMQTIVGCGGVLIVLAGLFSFKLEGVGGGEYI